MEVLQSLQDIGLSDKEARVYLALLESGRASAYSVAKKAEIKKPTAYVILDGLVEKGYATRIPRTRKQLFVARPPEDIFRVAEEKFKKAKSFLPELMAMKGVSGGNVKTLFFEGLVGMRQALWYKMDEYAGKEYVAFFASGVDASEDLMGLFREWNVAVKKLNITARAIVPEHPSLKEFRKLDEEYGREVKVVFYDTYSANISIDANERFVRIQMFKELQAVIIDNPNVARTFRQIFDMTWKSLSSNKEK